MGFTLRELAGEIPPAVSDMLQDNCPTGKVSFRSKAYAQGEVKRINRKIHRPMKVYRCDYGGDHFHIGHSRGTRD